MARPLSALAACAALVLALPAAAQAPRVLAEYPSGAFLENLAVAADGSAIVTSYFARTLERVAPDDAVATFAVLPAHPVSVLPDGDGWLVAVHGAPFTSGPEFATTQAFLRLDAAGAVTATIPAPDARFLNGMVRLDDGRVLVADSIAGVIWRLDVASGALAPWLAADVLAQPADMEGFSPGANGLKLSGDALYVSNSARGSLHRIALAGGAPAGEPVLVAKGPIDDFWVEADGAVVVATHSDALVQVAADGTRTELLATGCDGCTAVAPRGDDWLILTTGGLLEGRSAPARILALPRG